MKANRKFKEEEAVSAVIGVILMVAITVAIAGIVWIYITQIIGTAPTGNTIVSLADKGDYVQIGKITNGPVANSSVTYKVIDSSGADNTSDFTLTYNIAGSDLASGDTIGYSSSTSGTYTLQIRASDGSTVYGEVEITI